MSAEDTNGRAAVGAEDALELDLDSADAETDLERAFREAEQAVEAVESADRADQNRGASGDLERLEAELVDLRDRSKRTLADFDNFRKRADREREELRRFAAADVLRELLAVVDNLERAAAAPVTTVEDLKQGVEMILRQLHDVLKRQGVRTIDAQGQRFDPTQHEAVAREENPGLQEPTVAAELARGYFLHERLLRPAMVKVAVPAPRKGNEE